jgi:hypothetical protein
METWVVCKGGSKGDGDRKGGWSGWREIYGGCYVLWPLYMLGCICAVVMDGVFVRDCRGSGCVWYSRLLGLLTAVRLLIT